MTLRNHNLEIILPVVSGGRLKVTPRWFVGVSAVILVLVSILAWAFYYQQDLTLAYNDARSHLNIARRIVDSLQPGIAQIGSVWLPLYHILEIPFIWNDFLWRSGIAGSVVSMASYVLGGIYLIKITRELSFDIKASIVTLAIYMLNPNLLFMQTTPMTESLLIFLSVASVYYLLRWVKRFALTDLVASAIFVFLSTLTRYDGWFLLAFAFVTVGVVAYKKKGYAFAEGHLLLFGTLAGFGVFLWFLWNLMIFGDPLYFVLGPFSAKSQQDILLAEGLLFTKGNPVYSIFIYLLAVLQNVGVWVLILSILGTWLLVTSKKYDWSTKLVVSLLCVPIVFNIFSLIAGHSVIHLPELEPFTWFNDRYGLMVLPAIAIAGGFVALNRLGAFTIVTVLIALQLFIFYFTNNIITIQDGVRGASGQFLDEASAWIGENVDDGLVLVAASSNDAMLFKSGLQLKQFITEGARVHWDISMEDPSVHAKWIVMHKGDLVYNNMVTNEIFLENYKLVYRDDFTYIYLLDPISPRLIEQELPN